MPKKKSKEIRKVMIATPCHDGKMDAWFTNSILHTDRICREKNIEIDPVYLCFESILAKARNDLFRHAYINDYDDVVYIDNDIIWSPEKFIRLISHKVDFVAGVYPKKSNIEEYPVNIMPDNIKVEDGLMEVATVPTGFLRLSKNAIKKLWNTSLSYTVSNSKDENKMVFENGIIGERFMSEDVILCLKWRELGHKVYLDTQITLDHSGKNIWSGDFSKYLDKINPK